MFNSKIISALLVTVLMITSVDKLHAQSLNGSRLMGLKAGFLFPGGVTVSGARSRDFDVHSGLVLGLFWDFPVFRNFYLGPYFDYSSFTAAADDPVSKYDIGLTSKFQFSLTSDIVLRPALSVAYGYANITPDSSINNYVTEEGNDFFVYQVFLEAIYRSFLLDFGYTEATGGNEEDVYFYGQTFLRIGYVF